MAEDQIVVGDGQYSRPRQRLAGVGADVAGAARHQHILPRCRHDEIRDLGQVAEIVDRVPQALGQRHLRLPAERLARPRDVGLALLGSSAGSGRCFSFDFDPVVRITSSASSSIVNSPGLPRLTGPVTSSSARHQPDEALDQIVDVAEGAGLRAVAIDRDVVARQRLHDEVRDHAAVLGMHARAIGVEDARHLDLEPMLAVIIEEQRLGAALALVVAGARTDRIDVAPVILRLRMDRGIAIDLAGRGLEDPALEALGEPQHVDGAMDRGLGRLHRVVLVVNGRCRTGEIVDLVHLHVERKADVVAQELETRMVVKMVDVALGAGEEIVGAENLVPLLQKSVDQVRAEKSGSSRHENALPALVKSCHRSFPG